MPEALKYLFSLNRSCGCWQTRSMQPHEHTPTHADFWHSDDYSEVRTDGVVYFLTRNQAAVVRVMHNEHRRGRIEVEGAWLLRQTDCFCTRMAEVFRHSMAWKSLIVLGTTKGCYLLAPFIQIDLSPKYHRESGKSPRILHFHFLSDGQSVELATFLKRRPKRQPIGICDPPLPASPTHHPPCSIEKIQELAKRRERGEGLFHPNDFVPKVPVMIERYVFSGRNASVNGKEAASYIVAELLASSPLLRPGISAASLYPDS